MSDYPGTCYKDTGNIASEHSIANGAGIYDSPCMPLSCTLIRSFTRAVTLFQKTQINKIMLDKIQLFRPSLLLFSWKLESQHRLDKLRPPFVAFTGLTIGLH